MQALFQPIDPEADTLERLSRYATDSYRAVTSRDTLHQLQPVLKKIGITRLSNITGLDDIGIPVWQGIRPASRYLTVSQGKGLTHQQAKISAIMESLELYHLEKINLDTRHCSFRNRPETAAFIKPQHWHHGCLVQPDLEHLPLDWVTAENLITHQTCYVPKQAMTIDMRLSVNKAQCFRPSTTGIAGGNTISEASVKALLEIIERHSLKQLQQQPSLKLKAIKIPSELEPFQTILAMIERTNKSIRCFVIENAWQIPVYWCEIDDQQSMRRCGLCIGSGCHLDHQQAMLAAIVEAIQSRLTVIAASRDDNYAAHYANRHLIQPLAAGATALALPTSTFDTHQAIQPEHALQDIITRLKQSGTVDLYRINHTRQDIKIPMVQILIPSLGSV